jgi:hypothetical protein
MAFLIIRNINNAPHSYKPFLSNGMEQLQPSANDKRRRERSGEMIYHVRVMHDKDGRTTDMDFRVKLERIVRRRMVARAPRRENAPQRASRSE